MSGGLASNVRRTLTERADRAKIAHLSPGDTGSGAKADSFRPGNDSPPRAGILVLPSVRSWL